MTVGFSVEDCTILPGRLTGVTRHRRKTEVGDAGG